MEELFRNILNASIQGSVVIAVVFVLRLLLRKAPKKYICMLWILAGLRLLNPFPIESVLSLQPQGGMVTETRWQMLVQSGEILPFIWVVGAGAMLFYSMISYALLKLRLREAVRVGPEVWESDRIDTAFVLGYIRPCIYLPMNIRDIYREMVLLHERCHLKRLDHWVKLLMFVALATHWFNPLVWLAYVLLCWDTEYACDELVIRDMDLPQRKLYSAALLACSSRNRYLTASAVPFGEKPIKRRIKAVLNYRRPAHWATVLAIGALIVVALCLLTDPIV